MRINIKVEKICEKTKKGRAHFECSHPKAKNCVISLYAEGGCVLEVGQFVLAECLSLDGITDAGEIHGTAWLR